WLVTAQLLSCSGETLVQGPGTLLGQGPVQMLVLLGEGPVQVLVLLGQGPVQLPTLLLSGLLGIPAGGAVTKVLRSHRAYQGQHADAGCDRRGDDRRVHTRNLAHCGHARVARFQCASRRCATTLRPALDEPYGRPRPFVEYRPTSSV